jgi:hypothetical protein
LKSRIENATGIIQHARPSANTTSRAYCLNAAGARGNTRSLILADICFRVACGNIHVNYSIYNTRVSFILHDVNDQRCFCFNCNRRDMMHITKALLALLGAASYASADQFASRRSPNEPATGSSNAIPRRFIIELRSRAHGALAVDKIAGLAGLHVYKRFDSDIFPGVSVECDHECNADSLRAALDGDEGEEIVASVFQSSRMQLLPTIKGESFSDDAAASNYSVHGSTGVQELHDAGITGHGAVVAVVDSGVQYTHPAVKLFSHL